jgi:hypothetical protein
LNEEALIKEKFKNYINKIFYTNYYNTEWITVNIIKGKEIMKQ